MAYIRRNENGEITAVYETAQDDADDLLHLIRLS